MNRAHQRIKGLLEQRAFLKKQTIDIFNEAHPIGSRVYFRKWRGDIGAEVIDHDEHYEHIRVRTDKGKEYWVDFYWILNY